MRQLHYPLAIVISTSGEIYLELVKISPDVEMTNVDDEVVNGL